MPLYSYEETLPDIDADAFVAPSADVLGKVAVGAGSSIWYHCVVRGDVNFIRIGKNTNIQDGTVIHCESPRFGDTPTIIGDNITVGHMALLHACTVEDGAFIGMKAMVMNGAVVESKAMVAGGAIVTSGKVVKSGELWGGIPAKKMRDLTEQDLKDMHDNTLQYVNLGRIHQKNVA